MGPFVHSCNFSDIQGWIVCYSDKVKGNLGFREMTHHVTTPLFFCHVSSLLSIAVSRLILSIRVERLTFHVISNILDPDRRFRLIWTWSTFNVAPLKNPLLPHTIFFFIVAVVIRAGRIRYISPDSANLRHGSPRPVVGWHRRRTSAGSRSRQTSEVLYL